MHLLIQEIVVLWTKASRAEPLSSQRRLVANAMVLPPVELAQASLVKHRVTFAENSGFTAPEESCEMLSLSDSVQQGCVRVHRSSKSVWTINYQHTSACGGLPARDGKVWEKSLTVGEWGRVRYEGRLPDRDQVQWVYCARIFNIGWVRRFERGWFVDTAPQWIIEDNSNFF